MDTHFSTHLGGRYGFLKLFFSVPLMFITHAFFSLVDLAASHKQQIFDTTFSDWFFIFSLLAVAGSCHRRTRQGL
jgi:hypothetical protein